MEDKTTKQASQATILTIITVVSVVGLAGAIISPTNVISILGFSGMIITGLFTLLKVEVRANETAVKVEEAAAKVQEVKTNLETSDAHTNKQLADIHTLVNSNMGVQLKISAIALRKVAGFTKDADDEAAASLAERALAEHEGKQALVDKQAHK